MFELIVWPWCCQLSGDTPVVSVTDTDCPVSRLWHQDTAEPSAGLNRTAILMLHYLDILLERELMDAKPKYSKIGMSKFDWKLHWSCPEGKWWNTKHKRFHAMWDCSEMRVYDFHWQSNPAMKLKLSYLKLNNFSSIPTFSPGQLKYFVIMTPRLPPPRC